MPCSKKFFHQFVKPRFGGKYTSELRYYITLQYHVLHKGKLCLLGEDFWSTEILNCLICKLNITKGSCGTAVTRCYASIKHGKHLHSAADFFYQNKCFSVIFLLSVLLEVIEVL